MKTRRELWKVLGEESFGVLSIGGLVTTNDDEVVVGVHEAMEMPLPELTGEAKAKLNPGGKVVMKEWEADCSGMKVGFLTLRYEDFQGADENGYIMFVFRVEDAKKEGSRIQKALLDFLKGLDIQNLQWARVASN